MNLSLKNSSQLLNAKTFSSNLAFEIDNISIDSRSLQNNEKTLFFALVGPNNDAHFYIKELIAKNVRNFVVEKIPENLKDEANFLVVENTLASLQTLAGYYRNLFRFPIIGITGSNGKTIVKEWLNFLLSPDFNVVRSPKSYNSQVGVPLSIFLMEENNNFGIIEAGISTSNEMQKLQKMIRPTIGILTNIGSAHDEGFENISQKIKEKLKLFDEVEVLIYNKNKTIDAFLNPAIKTFSWSFLDKSADILIIRNKNNTFDFIVKDSILEGTQGLRIPFEDDASIENCMQCIATLLYLKYDFSTIKNRIAQLFPIEMRLKVKNGINNTTLIDDSYSSDFQSLKIALDFLENQKQYKKKTLILSDIFQSGLTDDELYVKVAQLVIANKINRVFAIGPTISGFKSKFVNCTAFTTTEEFVNHFSSLTFDN